MWEVAEAAFGTHCQQGLGGTLCQDPDCWLVCCALAQQETLQRGSEACWVRRPIRGINADQEGDV
eukprot:9685659-Lingulodinium_polyedra.AAC.1